MFPRGLISLKAPHEGPFPSHPITLSSLPRALLLTLLHPLTILGVVVLSPEDQAAGRTYLLQESLLLSLEGILLLDKIFNEALLVLAFCQFLLV